jgi:hypothetical protein
MGLIAGPNRYREYWDRVLTEIKATTRVAGRPSDGFDPRTATPERLEFYGFPARPDPATQPIRHGFWSEMFGSPPAAGGVTFLDVDFEYEPGTFDGFPPIQGGSGGPVRERSANWSGAYVAARGGRMLTEVHGSWTVPSVKPPADAPIGAEYRCSTWIGFDGQRAYRDASLPQIGTSQFVTVTDGAPVITTAVWWQWWVHGVVGPPPISLPLKVQPGHRVMCSLFVVDSAHVRFLIANRTTGEVCMPFVVAEPSVYLSSPHLQAPVSVSGATAEWITERPSRWPAERICELPDYDTVDFVDCHVVSGPAPQVDEREEQPTGARLINMYKVAHDPHRVVTISVADELGVGRFRTSYQPPG